LAATRALLARERSRALICFNDRLALGAYQALDDAGLTVPTDVSRAAAHAAIRRPRTISLLGARRMPSGLHVIPSSR
jgi:DNA-binding LacI/PurR family transcriptional regulator